MTALTADQFAAAVAATIENLKHLYHEVDQLNDGLLRGLLSEPNPFSFIAGTPPDPGRRGDRLRRKVLDQYHFLLTPGVRDDDDAEEDSEAEDDDDSPLEPPVVPSRLQRPGGLVTIDPGQAYLMVSVVLHDPARPGIQPHIRYAVLSGWGIGPDGKPVKDGPIRVSQWMITRAMRGLAAVNTENNRPIQTNAKLHGRSGRRGESLISVRNAAKPVQQPLFDLQGEGSLEALVERIKAFWHQAVPRPAN